MLTPDEGTQPEELTPSDEKETELETDIDDTSEVEEEEDKTPSDQEEDTPEEELENPEKPETPEPPKETPPSVDYEKKFKYSSRQNQIIQSQFDNLQKVVGDITKEEIPTDDEMARLVPEWEYLSDREKNIEKKLLILERRDNKILNSFESARLEQENARKLNEYIENEPKLKGQEDDFYKFASSPKNKGASMEVLLSAFLFETKGNEPAKSAETTPKETPPSLERGKPSGGDKPRDKSKGYTEEELKTLRTTDHKKYNELVRKGLI